MYWKPKVPLIVAADQEIRGIGVQPAHVVKVGIGNPTIDLVDTYLDRMDPQPPYVLNAGTAGGMGDEPGSIFVIDTVVDGTDQGREPLSLFVPEWAQDLPRRTIATVDHVVEDEAEHIELKKRAQIVDMELYDLVLQANCRGMPIASVKIVSDNADDGAFGTWLMVVEQMSAKLGEYLRQHIGVVH